MIELLINNGFELIMHEKSKQLYDPKNNWHGFSKYNPDGLFQKGNKIAIFSLNGVGTPYNEKYKELFNTMSCKYIKLKDGNKTIFETWTGELPRKETINSFMNGKA